MASSHINASIAHNLTEKEKKRINIFLSNDVYEKELKFQRPTAEVKCIIDCVNTIVEQVMAAVGDKEPLLEISHQYLVGSMAEGTSILDPKEFDFLVVLKHFSKPGAISTRYAGDKKYYMFNQKDQFRTEKGNFPVNKKLLLKDFFMSNTIKDIMSANLEPLHVDTNHGKLTINSSTVCHHGSASVVKLLWEPKSKSSKPLDILIDITPCIEQHEIDKVLKSDPTKTVIPDMYKSLILNEDTFMFILIDPILTANGLFPGFEVAITITELKIVNSLSSHHKMCYMLLKYCFNTIIHNIRRDNYHEIFPSYLIKTFLLRHAARCETTAKRHRDTEVCLWTCLMDIIDDLKDCVYKYEVNGTFGTFKMPSDIVHSSMCSQIIDNIIQTLVQIGKEGYSVDRHNNFRKECHRKPTHHLIQERADRLARDNVDCILSFSCKLH